MRKKRSKRNETLHPPTGDPFDKAHDAMDSLEMPKIKNSGLGDASDMFGKNDGGMGFGGFDKVSDGGFGGGSKKRKKGKSGGLGGYGDGFGENSGFGSFGKGSGVESLGSLGSEKKISKSVKKGKKKFDKAEKPFDMFGGLQQDF